jgi:hypothetical protein
VEPAREPLRMSELELDPTLLATLQALEAQAVEFVLVGDVAEAIYANGGFVSGVAIVPGAYSRNVDRLCNALVELGAELDGPGPARGPDIRQVDLRALAPCSFQTTLADVDLNFEPQGTGGYRDLFDDASHIQLAAGVNPLVASPADLERIARGQSPDAPYAQPPAVLPPEPDDGDAWVAEQIRASRAS